MLAGDVDLPFALGGGGDTGLTRLGGVDVTFGFSLDNGVAAVAASGVLAFASCLRMRSALLGGLSSALSYVTRRRLAAGSVSSLVVVVWVGCGCAAAV